MLETALRVAARVHLGQSLDESMAGEDVREQDRATVERFVRAVLTAGDRVARSAPTDATDFRGVFFEMRALAAEVGDKDLRLTVTASEVGAPTIRWEIYVNSRRAYFSGQSPAAVLAAYRHDVQERAPLTDAALAAVGTCEVLK